MLKSIIHLNANACLFFLLCHIKLENAKQWRIRIIDYFAFFLPPADFPFDFSVPRLLCVNMIFCVLFSRTFPYGLLYLDWMLHDYNYNCSRVVTVLMWRVNIHKIRVNLNKIVSSSQQPNERSKKCSYFVYSFWWTVSTNKHNVYDVCNKTKITA